MRQRPFDIRPTRARCAMQCEQSARLSRARVHHVVSIDPCTRAIIIAFLKCASCFTEVGTNDCHLNSFRSRSKTRADAYFSALRKQAHQGRASLSLDCVRCSCRLLWRWQAERHAFRNACTQCFAHGVSFTRSAAPQIDTGHRFETYQQ